ncbi:hypothetical protein ABVT39_018961 [Epinephelus coioides]
MVTEERDEAKSLLKKALTEIRDLKAQVKVQSEYKDIKILIKSRSAICDNNRWTPKTELLSRNANSFSKKKNLQMQRELQYSFEQSQSHRVFLDEPPLEAKRNTKSLKSSQEDLLLQSSPLFSHEHASCSRDIQPQADQTRGAFT